MEFFNVFQRQIISKTDTAVLQTNQTRIGISYLYINKFEENLF
jgi:hypothetical protein